jgi:hypothetical protein
MAAAIDPPSPPAANEPGGAGGSSTDDAAPPGWARWVSRISLVVALIAMTATIWAVGPGEIVAQLLAIGAGFVVIVAIEATSTVLDARAIYAVTRDHRELGFGRVLMAQIAGRAVNAVTPGGNLGEATKASVLTGSTSTTRAVAAVLFCGLASVIVQLAVIAIGAPLTAILLPLPAALRGALIGTGLLAGAVAVGLAILVRRGMLSSLIRVAVGLRLVSARRRARWRDKLATIDDRLRGAGGGRRAAVVYVIASKLLTWGSLWLIVAFAGYRMSIGELAALLSAGVVLTWISTLVPLGLGVTESGNYALFSALGAPPAFGVTLALARRVNQILYAAIGFTLLATMRVSATARRVAQRRKSRSTSCPPEPRSHPSSLRPRSPARGSRLRPRPRRRRSWRRLPSRRERSTSRSRSTSIATTEPPAPATSRSDYRPRP